MRHRFFLVFLSLALPVLPQRQQPSRGVNHYSLEDDELLRNYVTSLAARLNQFAQSPFPLVVEISANGGQVLQTVALPGGYMFVPLGLLVSARDEAELARSLAHGIAHIAARHGTRQATRAQIVNMATIPLVYIGGGHQSDGAQSLVPEGFRKFELQQEAEADHLAERSVTHAGFIAAPPSAEFSATQEPARTYAARPPTLRRP